MGGGGDNWELVAKLAALAIDTAESVEGLQRVMSIGPFDPIATPLPPGDEPYALPSGNAAAMALLKQHRPDLLPDLRTRFVLRKAHLYATGKAKAEPTPDHLTSPTPANAPANGIRKRL